MSIKTTSKIAISVSLLLSVFVFIIVFFVLKQSFFLSFIIFVAVALFNFSAVKYSFQHYLNNHIEIIYNILYDGKKSKIKDHSLVSLEEDALKWQQEQSQDLSNLQKQNDYRKEFLGNISHELKTPLFSIQGYIETLLDGGLNDDKINVAYLRKASDNVDRLSAIIEDLNTIAKVESDALNLNWSKFNIVPVIKSVIESLELLADKNDIEVLLAPTSNNYIVFADKEKISAVLVNLISNSLKYGTENGKTIIKLSELVDRVLIQVSDNGIGINKEQLPRVFERFYRVDSNRSREQGGSGLGLAIVKHIIEAHQQTITVKSELGQGTTFSFTLATV